MKKLTKERIETIKGQVLVKPPKERSSFEQTFLRAVAQLTKVQRMRYVQFGARLQRLQAALPNRPT